VKGTGYYSLTSVEARFNMVPVFIITAADLYQGKGEDKFSISFMQISDRFTMKDFKKRLVDVLEA